MEKENIEKYGVLSSACIKCAYAEQIPDANVMILVCSKAKNCDMKKPLKEKIDSDCTEKSK